MYECVKHTNCIDKHTRSICRAALHPLSAFRMSRHMRPNLISLLIFYDICVCYALPLLELLNIIIRIICIRKLLLVWLLLFEYYSLVAFILS